MTVIATALKHMLAAGMPHDAIVAAVTEMESQIKPQRSKGAERQARYRERHNASQIVTSDDGDVTRNDQPLSRPPNDNNSNPPTHTPENTSTRAKADPFPRPDGIDSSLWADFLKNRKTKKLTNTATAHAGVLTSLENLSARTGWPPGRVLAACVAKGWGAIYETDEMKEAINGLQPRKPNGRPADRGPDPIVDALRRATAEAAAAEYPSADPAGGFGTGYALPAQ